MRTQSRTERSVSSQRVSSTIPRLSCDIASVRLQPTCSAVPYQLLRGNQRSPTRSVSSPLSVAGSSVGPTTSRCSSPANPGGSDSDGRVVTRVSRRQTAGLHRNAPYTLLTSKVIKSSGGCCLPLMRTSSLG